MSEIKLVKFRFLPGKKQSWLEWAEELKQRKEEALATLRNEEVFTEVCFISADRKYIYYLMEAEDLEKTKKVSEKSIHPIDKEHGEKINSSLEFVEVLPVLFYFTTKEN